MWDESKYGINWKLRSIKIRLPNKGQHQQGLPEKGPAIWSISCCYVVVNTCSSGLVSPFFLFFFPRENVSNKPSLPFLCLRFLHNLMFCTLDAVIFQRQLYRQLDKLRFQANELASLQAENKDLKDRIERQEAYQKRKMEKEKKERARSLGRSTLSSSTSGASGGAGSGKRKRDVN